MVGSPLTHRPVRGRALFDFDPSPEYPEQVLVTKDESFRVVEDYRDGWTMIRKRNGKQGVIPTSYYSQIRLTLKEQILEWLQLLLEQFLALVELVLRTVFSTLSMVLSYVGSELYTRIYAPALEYTLEKIKNNETAQSMLSLMARKVHSRVTHSFLSEMTTDELNENIEEVESYIQRVLIQERSRIPANRSSFEVISGDKRAQQRNVPVMD